MPDFRRAQGRKHTIASVFAINTVASLACFESGIAVAQFARVLNQTELKMLGAWFNPKTEKYEPPSKSVIYGVRQKADPAAMESVLKRWSMGRLNIDTALAADGKRLRGANRNGDGHFETATLVAHDTGLPVASQGFHDESGERAAIAALFEEVPLAGHVITLDALHTARDTARSIVETHNADYLMTVKANAPETFETLSTINWNRDATGAFEEEPTKGHGRIDCRRIQTMTPLPGTVNFPHIAQIFRIERDRKMCKSRKKAPKSPTESLQFQMTGAHLKTCLHGTRGHWSIENNNHRVRDVNFKEDACLSRTMHAPNNGAICNCIALAIIVRRSPKIAEMRRYFNLHRHEAVKAVLSPH